MKLEVKILLLIFLITTIVLVNIMDYYLGVIWIYIYFNILFNHYTYSLLFRCYLNKLFFFAILIVWNQGLVNFGFNDNKTRFRTNNCISSVIRQDDFQSSNHKDKSSQREIIKKKKTSKRSVFQDPNFIRSLCKTVGVLRF